MSRHRFFFICCPRNKHPGRDLNPRSIKETTVFKTGTINLSVTWEINNKRSTTYTVERTILLAFFLKKPTGGSLWITSDKNRCESVFSFFQVWKKLFHADSLVSNQLNNFLQSFHPDTSKVPNNSVDMSSKELSACYPRRTFYPLSDTLSTQQYRITIAWSWLKTTPTLANVFAKVSQNKTITFARTSKNLFRFNIAHLRYILGGNRPS